MNTNDWNCECDREKVRGSAPMREKVYKSILETEWLKKKRAERTRSYLVRSRITIRLDELKRAADGSV